MTESRHRERLIKSDVSVATYERDSQPGTQEWDTFMDYEYETMDDEVVPNFKERRNNGEVFFNSCVHVRTSEYCVGSGSEIFTTIYDEQIRKEGPSLSSMELQRIPSYVIGYLAPPSDRYDHEAASKLRALAAIDSTPYAFLEDVFEIRETIKFIRGPFKTLITLFRRFWDAVRQKQVSLDLVDAISNTWLEFRFAITPLVRSCWDAFESLTHTQNDPVRRTARGWSRDEQSLKDTMLNTGFTSSATTSQEVQHWATIVYEESNPINGWRDKYGLRFRDIPTSVWAVMPYSFMIDRVVDISAALTGLISYLSPDIKILGACHTRSELLTQTFTYEGYKNPAYIKSYQAQTWDTQVVITDTYTRTPWQPGLADLVPTIELFGLVDSITKIADLAALIYQAARR